ncbi:MAG: TetR family transcriptional regulator [Gammaproteobacteria bacterium]
MKISEKDKIKTRINILKASVEVITDKGFRSASMREISRSAGVSDATIYNYFPTKETLLFGYCEYVQKQVLEALGKIDDFHEYSLQEQLQQCIEIQLHTWLPARDFLHEVFEHIYASPVAGATQLNSTKEIFNSIVTELLDAAIDAEEIPDQPYQDLLPRLFWDYQTGILAYWLNDDSEDFTNTSQLVDKSMGIIAIILHQGVVGKLQDLVSFLFRTHIMAQLGDMMDSSSVLQTGSKRVKRRFMDKGNT